MIVDILAALGSLWVAVMSFDRLRQINWKRNRWLFVAAYVCLLLASIVVISKVMLGDSVPWYVLLHLAAVQCYFCLTRRNWPHGPPLYSFHNRGRDLSPEEYYKVSGGRSRRF